MSDKYDEDEERRMEEYFRQLRRAEVFLVLWYCLLVICGIVLFVLALVGWVDWAWVIFPFLPLISHWWSGPYRWIVSRVMRFLNSFGR